MEVDGGAVARGAGLYSQMSVPQYIYNIKLTILGAFENWKVD